MKRQSLANRRVLLTGASSGIGRTLAERLAAVGARLLLLARREELLKELAEKLDAAYVVGDVTEPDTRAAALQKAEAELGGLDILVNNAGVTAHGRFATSEPETLRRVMEVNFFAAAELVREAVPMLRRGAEPLIVNVGSVLGHRGTPHNSEYCASKFALQGWSEAIRPELAREGIDLLMVSPGRTETELFDRPVSRQESIPFPWLKALPAERVAEQIVRAILRGSTEIFPNSRGGGLLLLNRLAPRLVDRIMKRYG